MRIATLLLFLTLVPLSAEEPELPDSVTYNEHIAPILYQQCTPCHRAGEAAPFTLSSYEDAQKRGRLIGHVTQSRYMPPWKPDTSDFAFQDERKLTDEQIRLIQRWVAQGMPEGDPEKATPFPEYPEGWQLGKPDLIVEMPEAYLVPAEGPDVYRNFVIPIQLPEDRWIRAIELRPSARSVVHHVLFFADTTGAAQRADASDPEPGYSGMAGLTGAQLGGWAVGAQPHLYPEEYTLRLPRRSDLVLQYHFHPTGKQELERTTVGIYLASKPPTRTLTGLQFPPLFGFLNNIRIPANEPAYTVKDSFTLPVDVEGISIGGHAHYIGKTMTFSATFPDGERKTLLRISDWDFAWQDRYFFKELVSLPAGTKLEAEISWDNSADNPRNPTQPPVEVRWGEESRDEMGSLTLELVPRREQDRNRLQTAYMLHMLGVARQGLLQDPASAEKAFRMIRERISQQ